MLSFFPRDVLDEIVDLIESVSGGFPTYSFILLSFLEFVEIRHMNYVGKLLLNICISHPSELVKSNVYKMYMLLLVLHESSCALGTSLADCYADTPHCHSKSKFLHKRQCCQTRRTFDCSL